MDLETMRLFTGELLPEETVLWSGKPNASVIFNKLDIFLIPFSVFWFGFSIFMTIAASSERSFLNLFGIPFVLIGFYLAIGRFFVKIRQKKRTAYAITNKRVLIMTLDANGGTRNTAAADIRTILSELKTNNRHANGNIMFGAVSMQLGLYNNTGLNFINYNQPEAILAFYDIDDVDQVYEIFKKAKYT